MPRGIPSFNEHGNLPPGVHEAEWDEFKERFGTTPSRCALIAYLEKLIAALSKAGCRTLYVDGSFVTSKRVPKDYDAVWDPADVDITALDPSLLNSYPPRKEQQEKYKADIFHLEDRTEDGDTMLHFFQHDKNNHRKGVIQLRLERIKL